MIITLNMTPAELAEEPKAELETLFSELLRASAKGYHLIIIPRALCEWADGNLDLNSAQRAQLKRIKISFTTVAGTLNVALVKLIVDIGRAGIREAEPGEFRIGHLQLIQENYLGGAVSLIMENTESDEGLYSLILDATKKHVGYPVYSYSPVFGGGSGMLAALRNEIRKKSIVVCLVDSDKRSPSCPVSSTAQSLQKEAERANTLAVILSTVCREAENHIPFYILFDQKLCPNFNSIQKLEAIAAKNLPKPTKDDFWLYFDVKNGIDGQRVSASEIPEGVKNWIFETYRIDEDELEDLKVQGFGENVVNVFCNSNAACAEFHRYTRRDFWAEHFKDFFCKLYWFFVAEKALATNPL